MRQHHQHPAVRCARGNQRAFDRAGTEAEDLLARAASLRPRHPPATGAAPGRRCSRHRTDGRRGLPPPSVRPAPPWRAGRSDERVNVALVEAAERQTARADEAKDLRQRRRVPAPPAIPSPPNRGDNGAEAGPDVRTPESAAGKAPSWSRSPARPAAEPAGDAPSAEHPRWRPGGSRRERRSSSVQPARDRRAQRIRGPAVAVGQVRARAIAAGSRRGP